MKLYSMSLNTTNPVCRILTSSICARCSRPAASLILRRVPGFQSSIDRSRIEIVGKSIIHFWKQNQYRVIKYNLQRFCSTQEESCFHRHIVVRYNLKSKLNSVASCQFLADMLTQMKEGASLSLILVCLVFSRCSHCSNLKVPNSVFSSLI